jgi:N-acetyl sugar amidotransferase
MTVCVRCVMDNSDPLITFDEKGVCSHCRSFDENSSKVWFPNEEGKRRLAAVFQKIKNEGINKDYDCILGLSGGVDSSYVAYLTKEWGLRVLAFHVDAGWNSELAVKNIELLVKKFKLDLFTYVVNWEEVQDVQRAFFRAGVANQDIPQDHVFFATLYKFAAKKGIKYILTGSNYATESVLPTSWGYDNMDAKHLKAIHKLFGSKKLKTFKTMSFLEHYLFHPFIYRLKIISPLNYMVYDKNEVRELLKDKMCWKDYKQKHGESRFTKFFQNYYLPHKFGFDKRKAHLSSMILSQTITRDEALLELQKPLYDPSEFEEDRDFFIKKLGISRNEFDTIISIPPKRHEDYPSNKKMLDLVRRIKFFLRKRGFKIERG